MPIEIKENQTLLDIAVQEKGGVDAAFDLAIINDKSITDALQSGEVIVTDGDLINKSVADFYGTKNLKAASNVPGAAGVEVEEGIEFWAIEYDFIVT